MTNHGILQSSCIKAWSYESSNWEPLVCLENVTYENWLRSDRAGELHLHISPLNDHDECMVEKDHAYGETVVGKAVIKWAPEYCPWPLDSDVFVTSHPQAPEMSAGDLLIREVHEIRKSFKNPKVHSSYHRRKRQGDFSVYSQDNIRTSRAIPHRFDGQNFMHDSIEHSPSRRTASSVAPTSLPTNMARQPSSSTNSTRASPPQSVSHSSYNNNITSPSLIKEKQSPAITPAMNSCGHGMSAATSSELSLDNRVPPFLFQAGKWFSQSRYTVRTIILILILWSAMLIIIYHLCFPHSPFSNTV